MRLKRGGGDERWRLRSSARLSTRTIRVLTSSSRPRAASDINRLGLGSDATRGGRRSPRVALEPVRVLVRRYSQDEAQGLSSVQSGRGADLRERTDIRARSIVFLLRRAVCLRHSQVSIPGGWSTPCCPPDCRRQRSPHDFRGTGSPPTSVSPHVTVVPFDRPSMLSPR